MAVLRKRIREPNAGAIDDRKSSLRRTIEAQIGITPTIERMPFQCKGGGKNYDKGNDNETSRWRFAEFRTIHGEDQGPSAVQLTLQISSANTRDDTSIASSRPWPAP